MLDALWIAVIGMGTVFLVLGINYVLVVLIGRFGRERIPAAQPVQPVEPPGAEDVAAEPDVDAEAVQAAPADAEQPPVAQVGNGSDDARLHAAIAAAIRAYEEEIAVSHG